MKKTTFENGMKKSSAFLLRAARDFRGGLDCTRPSLCRKSRGSLARGSLLPSVNGCWNTAEMQPPGAACGAPDTREVPWNCSRRRKPVVGWSPWSGPTTRLVQSPSSRQGLPLLLRLASNSPPSSGLSRLRGGPSCPAS